MAKGDIHNDLRRERHLLERLPLVMAADLDLHFLVKSLQKIEQLVSDIIGRRIAEGQLDECDLTLKEIKIIAETFRFTVQNMLHTRIKYPKDEERAEQEGRRLRNLPPATAA